MSRLTRKCFVADCADFVWAREMCRTHYYRWHKHGDPCVTIRRQSPAGAPLAFLDAVPAGGDGCLTWPFATNGAGYAQINNPATGRALVTRLVCERFLGPPPTPAHVAAHSCGKGHEACIAPWHLSWKTHAENMADRDGHGTLLHGEAVAKKLTTSDVRLIMAMRGTTTQQEIAARFGVSQTLISRIHLRKAWARVSAGLIGVEPEQLTRNVARAA